jgi:hypothetical protein
MKFYKGKQIKFAIAILVLTANAASALTCSKRELAYHMDLADRLDRKAQRLANDPLGRASRYQVYDADQTAGNAAVLLLDCLR